MWYVSIEVHTSYGTNIYPMVVPDTDFTPPKDIKEIWSKSEDLYNKLVREMGPDLSFMFKVEANTLKSRLLSWSRMGE